MKIVYNAIFYIFALCTWGYAQNPDLRLINRSTGEVVNSISINTNDTISLCAQSRIGDEDTEWEYISVKWHFPPSIWLSDIKPPEYQQCIMIISELPVSDSVKIKTDNDSLSIPLTINSVDSVESIFIILLTPSAYRVAGDTILAVVQIRNNNGPVPGVVCLDSVRYSITGPGVGTLEYSALVNGSNILLDSSINQCFSGSGDTVKFILNNQVQNAFEYRISVMYKNKSDSTEQFSLLPMSSGPVFKSRNCFQKISFQLLNNSKIRFLDMKAGVPVCVKIMRTNGQLVHQDFLRTKNSRYMEYNIPLSMMPGGYYILDIKSFDAVQHSLFHSLILFR